MLKLVQMQTVLITGVAGFIGSNLAELLLRRGIEVFGIDNFDDYYPAVIKQSNLNPLNAFKQFYFFKADIRNYSVWMKQMPASVDCVIHLAAKAGVRYSIMFPQGYEDTNVNGTLKAFELAKVLNARQFIFCSSSSVYGNNPDTPWDESALLFPDNPYAKTKVLSENLLYRQSVESDINIMVLRLFSVYGPRMRPDLMMNRIFESMASGASIPVFGDGNSQRDYTYIDDIVNGIYNSMRYDKAKFEIINLGNSYPVALLDVIKIFEDKLGQKAKLDFLPVVNGESLCTFASIEKAGKLLNYFPKTLIEQGISKYIEYRFKKH